MATQIQAESGCENPAPLPAELSSRQQKPIRMTTSGKATARRLDLRRVHQALAEAADAAFSGGPGHLAHGYAGMFREFHHKSAQEPLKPPLPPPRKVCIDAKRIHAALASGCQQWQDKASAAWDYALRYFPKHLGQSDQWERLTAVLCNFHFLEARVTNTGVEPLLQDYEWGLASQTGVIPQHQEELDLTQSALRLSAHVLNSDPEQLASQLTSRLDKEVQGGIRDMVAVARNWRGAPWLRSLHGNLHPPGTSLLRTLKGHVGDVRTVTLSADGRRAVSGSEDHTLKVWDVERGRELWTLVGHSGKVTAVAVSADGQRAVSGSYDRTVKVWDVESGRELRTLRGHASAVAGVAISADGRRAVSGSGDRTLKVWDVERGRELRTLQGHVRPVNAVAMSADGRQAVSGSIDGTLKVWDLESGRELRTLEGHDGSVTAVAVSADGRRAVSGSDHGTLKVWDVESGQELRTLQGHASTVEGVGVSLVAVAVSADGRWAVSGGGHGTVRSRCGMWRKDRSCGRSRAMLAGSGPWR